MTQEDKDLLFKDLCARLPYGVKVNVIYSTENASSLRQRVCTEGVNVLNTDIVGLYQCNEIDIKPYLLPLSSMTEEQKKEYCSLVWFDGLSNGWNSDDAVILNEVEMLIDFYHKNHLDWREFIEKGLALDATGLNIY